MNYLQNYLIPDLANIIGGYLMISKEDVRDMFEDVLDDIVLEVDYIEAIHICGNCRKQFNYVDSGECCDYCHMEVCEDCYNKFVCRGNNPDMCPACEIIYND